MLSVFKLVLVYCPDKASIREHMVILKACFHTSCSAVKLVNTECVFVYQNLKLSRKHDLI